MYYVVNDVGQTDGPFPADWIRSNARPGTLVSHQQQWVTYASHPDFQGAAPHSVSVHKDLQGLAVPIRARWAISNLASKSNRQILLESVMLLGIGIACCLLLLLVDQAYLHGMHSLSGERILGTLQMTLVWLIVFSALLLPAYLLGRLFGGHGRFSEAVYAFSRSLTVLYIVLPFSLLLYNVWFKQLIDKNFIAALLIIFLFLFVVPLICLFFAFIAVRVLVKSMRFRSWWQAWATIISATIVTVIACLFLGDWFRWFSELMK